jgi:hypothetical protein
MTIDRALNDLRNKDFSTKKGTPEQLVTETKWTDILQSLIDWGNTHVLENFRYGLVMEDDGVNQGIDKS